MQILNVCKAIRHIWGHTSESIAYRLKMLFYFNSLELFWAWNDRHKASYLLENSNWDALHMQKYKCKTQPRMSVVRKLAPI